VSDGHALFSRCINNQEPYDEGLSAAAGRNREKNFAAETRRHGEELTAENAKNADDVVPMLNVFKNDACAVTLSPS